MKNVLIAALVAIALASCAKNEIIDEVQKYVITFDDTFIDNATKTAYDASYNNDNLSEFEVYGTITGVEAGEGTANIFNKERVVKGNSLGQGTEWSYAIGNTQYWIPGNKYNFRAVADGNITGVSEVVAVESDNYMATAIKVLDASAQKDILIAEDLNVMYNVGDGAKTIEFTFSHIMAKAKFTIKNTITTDSGYSYKVSNIRLLNTIKNSVYTFDNNGAGVWSATATSERYTLGFGNAVVDGTISGAEAVNIGFNTSVESNYDRLLIPSNERIYVLFDYLLLKDGVVIDTQVDHKVHTTSSYDLNPGHAYNFVIKMGNPGEPIKFSVEKVNGWDTDLNDNDVADDDIDIN